MKTTLFLVLGSILVTACASAPKPEAAAAKTTSAALTVEPVDEKTAAEKWAEQKVHAEEKAAAKGKSDKAMDPLAMNDSLEEAAIPKVELTPAKELRAKGRGDLQAALAVMGNASSLDDAARKIVARIGKPTWTENGQKRIWVVAAGAQCHRLVLQPDGTAEVETASKDDWRMLSATARQNPCTGEIKRGITSK